MPFGFEFISRVTFRDVNFGEMAKPGEAFKVADKELSRPGFRLCRHCGKVQKAPRRNGNATEQTHAFDCPKHGTDDPTSVLECLYLYREFESEALRILVPYTKNGVDERVVQSFMAALQLGLKRRFGGKVDHLRMVLQDEPGKNGGPRKYYVMLYDSVPGGTGYLHQLLAHDAGTLADVLRMALEAVTSCACNADPEKDGCYRCLYQYRLGRSMQLVSRDNAKAVLSELVGALDQLERVETISDIYINPNFDSVLEARFIESLKRLSGVGGLPLVKLVQDVVNGKSGWVLDVGTQRYRIEPQCEIGPEFNLTVWSKPDFVIWPWSATSKRKPIAVFCDGWTDHQHCMRADALKRSAIVSSGRLWVWSVTHDDVKAALNGSLDSDLESPLAALSRHDGGKAPAHIPHAQEKAYTQHAVARLLNWLAVGSENAGNDAALPMLQRNALWLGYLMIPATEADKAACMAEFAQWRPRLPEAVQEPGAGFAPSLSKAPSACAVVGWWPMVWAKPSAPEPGWSAPGVVALDESLAGDGETLHLAWRRWLQLYNASQFLPGRLMVTGSGLDGHDYDVLAGASEHDSAGAPAGAQEAHLAAWQDVLDQALSGMRDGLKALAFAGADLPEVGLELADAKGLVIADAELAWVSQKLVVLRPDQADIVSEWVAAGWQVSELDESLVLVGDQPWQVAVAEKLGVKLMNGEDTCS